MTVSENESGQRLDRYLRKIFPSMPISHIYKLIRTRKIRLNGKRPHIQTILESGDRIIIHMQEERFTSDTKRPRRKPVQPTFNIVFEDDHLLVVSKPAGLSVHGGKGHEKNSLIDQVHTYLGVPEQLSAFRPSLAHRLDRDTSGLLLIGKSGQALRTLGRMLKTRHIAKHYLALVLGKPKKPSGTWKFRVQRLDVPGGNQPHRTVSEKPGLTEYRLAMSRTLHLFKGIAREISLLDLHLITGRTHQIRSHLQQSGLPLAGDPRYGDPDFNRMLRKRYNLKRQFLHAYRIELAHPITQKPIILTDPFPDDLLGLARSLDLKIP